MLVFPLHRSQSDGWHSSVLPASNLVEERQPRKALDVTRRDDRSFPKQFLGAVLAGWTARLGELDSLGRAKAQALDIS